MHKAWLKSFTVAVCTLGLAASAALASPASMAIPGHQAAPASTSKSIWPWSKSTAVAPAPTAAQPPQTWPVAPTTPPVYPSSLISPWKHPIKYLGATVSEMPIGKNSPTAHPAVPTVPPAQPKTDKLSLSVPTGPASPEFFIFAAQMCEKQGDIPQARQNLGRALTMWPGNPEVLRAAARMEDRQGNLAQAESLYQQAVAANPQNAAALNDLGLCLAREGKLEPSLQVIEQAVQLQPDKALYRNNAATVLVEMRQDQRALAHLSAVHNPGEANFNLGQLLVDRGRSADAPTYFQAALQHNPSMQQAQDALAKLGAQANYGPQIAAAPTAVPQQAAPVGPQFAPQQQTWPTGPQFNYPATARTSAPGATGYVPPRSLPPVPYQPQPGAMQR